MSFPNQPTRFYPAILLSGLLGLHSPASIGNTTAEANALELAATRTGEQPYHLKLLSRHEVDGVQHFTILNQKSRTIQEINLDQNDREVSP